MPRFSNLEKVMVIGSGPIIIGQAAEFDYAGAQACSVLRAEGLEVVLVNSNPATIMTDKSFAQEIYLEPLNVETVERIIADERPQALLAGLGGQTGLTLAMQLQQAGVLERYGVQLLGTDINAINKAEDRELFAECMREAGQPVIPSDIANDIDHALAIAEEIGYPVIVRPAFTLGGTGGGIAATPEELHRIAQFGLDMSPITQVLIERCVSGWQEIEFETMRDSTGHAIAVCSMENFDPVGVHTGDSIVAAPALSLRDDQLQMLHDAALDIVGTIGVIGGCNVQFALKPNTLEYAVIEVNPRVSRSSALASKATGYPIAKITTKLSIGYTLDEIAHPETGASLHGFEPNCKYVVVKFPKWPFDKFANASRRLGTQMKATGEVMSIAHSFEAALMKAVRGAEIGLDTLDAAPLDERDVRERLADQDDRRLFTVYEALRKGVSAQEIYDITKIDFYFLEKLQNVLNCQVALEAIGAGAGAAGAGAAGAGEIPFDLYKQARELGFTDTAIKRLTGVTVLPVSHLEYRPVDTCASIFGDDCCYFYSEVVVDEQGVTGTEGASGTNAAGAAGATVAAGEEGTFATSTSATSSDKPTIIVLGSGPIRIGQGIEFDYSCVHCVWELRRMGYDVIIINNNPETVSTDYDTADRLYFEPLTPEDVMGVIAKENPIGVVVAFGGQTAIKLTQFLDAQGIQILGTSAEGIDIAEDRARFDALLEQFDIRRPKGYGVLTIDEALDAAHALGYPVLLRPSYVIGGQNMVISTSDAKTREYMTTILSGNIENPVLVDKYMPGVELEVDVISDGTNVLIPGIMEHVERAGVHSGDSIAVYPPYNLTNYFKDRICECSKQLALALGTKGLVNIQYLIYEYNLYVIEVNPRASRTIPYISKVTGVPMVDIATRVMLEEPLESLGYGTGLYPASEYFAVKVPVFSFEKLNDANSILGPEMKSTGEVLGIGRTKAEALFKGLMAAGFKLPHKDEANAKEPAILFSVEDEDFADTLAVAKRMYEAGLSLYATPDTYNALITSDIPVTKVIGAAHAQDIWELLEAGKLDYLVYTGAVIDDTNGDYLALARRAMQLGVPCLTSLDTAAALAEIIESNFDFDNTQLVDINHM